MMDIDLNLLKVFEIMSNQRNVTMASARLFLTQSATSHPLARLRDVLGDPCSYGFLRACSQRSVGSRDVPGAMIG
jgi:hypothetical protein